jgi:hypothetical protein
MDSATSRSTIADAPALAVAGVSHAFGERQVLRDVSFVIRGV